jgi:hypothetical protein
MKEFFNSLKPKAISVYKSLSKNDYVKAGVEAAIGAVAGYVLPILSGGAIFSLVSAKAALTGAVVLGLRKAITLFFTNSNGEVFKKESDTITSANPVIK